MKNLQKNTRSNTQSNTRSNTQSNAQNNIRGGIRNNRMMAYLKAACAVMLAAAVTALSGCAGAPGAASAGTGNAAAGTGAAQISTEQDRDVPEVQGELEVHFIDVGQADSALVLCEGESMLIDGGNAADSDLIYTYLKKLELEHLNYIVCTHAHEDHVGGLSGALNYATVDVAFAPVTDYTSKVFNNFKNNLEKQGKEITVPNAGDVFELGSAEVTVLGPVHESEDPNNTSIVLRVVYGETSFLFTGDAEREEEQDILETGRMLKSTVLKVGHHGSDTSTSYPFLREIMPEYAVISVGTGNSYGHPTEDTLSRLRDADVKVYRTDLQGDIICTSDGKNVTFTAGRNADMDTLASVGSNSIQQKETEAKAEAAAASEAEYILNTGTKKFHRPDCSSVEKMKEENKQSFTGSREDVIAQGYDPCGICNP